MHHAKRRVRSGISRRGLALQLSAIAAAAGCVTTSGPPPRTFISVNETPRPLRPRSVESVALYRVKAPEAPFVEVGWFSRTGGNDMDALLRLRIDAAELGCDGLVVNGVSDAAIHSSDYTGTFLNKNQYGPDYEATYVAQARGTCIVFENDPGTWQPPAVVSNPGDCEQYLAAARAKAEPKEKLKILKKMPRRCHDKRKA